MKISCNIIRDILPLYVDNVVSDDTRDMTEEHLAISSLSKHDTSIPAVAKRLAIRANIFLIQNFQFGNKLQK